MGRLGKMKNNDVFNRDLNENRMRSVLTPVQRQKWKKFCVKSVTSKMDKNFEERARGGEGSSVS